MTAQERIDAAIAARPQATPGPWKAELCLGGSYVIDNTLPETRDKVRRIAEVYGHLSTPSDSRLIAAAPDLVAEVVRLRKEVVEYQMALAGAEALVLSHEGTIEKRDREIEQLQKWQQEVSPYLKGSAAIMKLVGASGDQITTLDRLIAEAQEE